MPPQMMFLVLCMTGLILFKGIHSSAIVECSTPGFYLSNDQAWCFGISKVYKTAPVQNVYCKLNGASLVTIDSADKETQVGRFLSDIGAYGNTFLFMGLTNIIGTQTDWVWYQGSDTSAYTNWDTSNPVTTSKTNCAAFRSGNPDYKWKNDYCLRTFQAVCQRPATSADLTTTF